MHKDATFTGEVGAAVALDVKFLEGTEGEFEGYGAVFGNIDGGGDILEPGAFSKSLRKGTKRIKMLWQHDPSEPIGVWTDIVEDDRGLRVKGKLELGIRRGLEAHTMLKTGIIDSMSIGYRTVVAEYDSARDIRSLKELDLWEISLVTFPMNPKAMISSVKGAEPTEREFETWLKRDAGFTAQQAKAIIARGYKAMLTERDAGALPEPGLSEAFNDLLAELRRGS